MSCNLHEGCHAQCQMGKRTRSHSSEDYVTLLEQYGKPILAVTGTADISTDYRRLSVLNGVPFAESYALKDVNHILREI